MAIMTISVSRDVIAVHIRIIRGSEEAVSCKIL